MNPTDDQNNGQPTTGGGNQPTGGGGDDQSQVPQPGAVTPPPMGGTTDEPTTQIPGTNQGNGGMGGDAPTGAPTPEGPKDDTDQTGGQSTGGGMGGM